MPPDMAIATIDRTALAMPLSRAGVGETVVICKVVTGMPEGGSDVGLRLLELGFVEGEALRIIAHGFPGREPIAVRIGNTTFALRRFEADHVWVVPALPSAVQS
jgi:ferrous iron transport protein A